MKIRGVVLVVVLLLCSSMAAMVGGSSHGDETVSSDLVLADDDQLSQTVNADDAMLSISEPAAGYLYLFRLRPLPLPIAQAFDMNHAVVVGRSLDIDTVCEGVDHVQFIAKQMVTGWEVIRWDYNTIDGLSMDMGLNSGLYRLTAIGYDDVNSEVARSEVSVLFVKVGGDNFGVWVHTSFDSGETYSYPLELGLSDFSSMISSGESRLFPVSLQQEDDTDVELRFRRTRIMDSEEQVIETKFNVHTRCDTSKQYEVALEVRFPFYLLNDGQPEAANPLFSAKVGYVTFDPSGQGLNMVDSSFYFGRTSLDEPRVFRLSVTPDTLSESSEMTFFTSYSTVDADGSDIFHRSFTVGFSPATELMITSVPREAKIQYAFGESAGVKTAIFLNAAGGFLDAINQQFTIDPLPEYMNFDLTILGGRELIYESDRSYDVGYQLLSDHRGELLEVAFEQVPQSIKASWSVDSGEVGDLALSSFVDLNMSAAIPRLAVFCSEKDTALLEVVNVPSKVRLENNIDIINGEGNFSVYRLQGDPREITVSTSFDAFSLSKSFVLFNSYFAFDWAIHPKQGVGLLRIQRDSDSESSYTTSLSYKDWTFSKTVALRSYETQLSWDVNRSKRQGSIVLSKSNAEDASSVTFSLAHESWVVSDTVEFSNEHLEFFWDLPAGEETHAEVGFVTGGDELVRNTFSVVDDEQTVLAVSLGIQTEDHLIFSWENIDGVIADFQWSGRLLRLSDLDIAVDSTGDLFHFKGDLLLGESGFMNLGFNKDVKVTFVDHTGDRFKVQGDMSFFADSEMQIDWELGESGEYTIYTFNKPMGDAFHFEFGWDPDRTGNYRYGFRLVGENFIQITRTIKWYSEDDELQRIWVLGDLPLPGDWTLQVLWNHNWYPVPWPET